MTEYKKRRGSSHRQCHLAIGRSLIRTFLADATKDAVVYEMSDEQAQKEKM